MSQQHMDPGEHRLDDPHTIYSAYDVFPKYDTYSNSPPRQKLTTKSNPASLSSDQRLALAIFSLVLWVIVCVIVVISILHVPVTNVLNQGEISVDNPHATITYIVLISALLLFTMLTLGINILFNRRG